MFWWNRETRRQRMKLSIVASFLVSMVIIQNISKLGISTRLPFLINPKTVESSQYITVTGYLKQSISFTPFRFSITSVLCCSNSSKIAAASRIRDTPLYFWRVWAKHSFYLHIIRRWTNNLATLFFRIGCNNNCDIACCYCDITKQPPLCIQCCREERWAPEFAGKSSLLLFSG